MKSMTGFGRSTNRLSSSAPKKVAGKKSARLASAEKQSEAASSLELDVSIKAVNGRYLDVRFHLPREYSGLEGEFKSVLAGLFSRGTLDVYINRTVASGASGIQVNTRLAQQWLDSYGTLKKALKLKGEPSLEWLVRIPEIFHVQDRTDVSDAEKELVKKLVREAAEACNRERAREGDALQTELSTLCARLEELGGQIETLKVEANAELEKRLRDRLQDHLKKLGFDGKVDDQRLAQEVVIYIDRADISEELTRLREHLKAYRQLLKNAASEGKKLDFYAQELLREVNTIGSKSHIAKLTSLVVDAKTLVEKIREQVQNVE